MSSAPRSRRGSATTLTVRPASLADAAVIVRFRLGLLREHRGHAIYGNVRSDAEARLARTTPMHLASGREITCLALDGRTPVGMLRCLDVRGSPLLTPARYGYIASAYVAPSHRRRGVLKRLVDAAATWARARGLTELRVHATPENAVASTAWEKLGFPTVESLRRRELPRPPGA